MKKQLIIIGIILILLTVLLSGCNENSRDKRFVGTWIPNEVFGMPGANQTVTFYSDGYYLVVTEFYGSITRLDATWDLVEHGKLRLTYANGGYIEYIYSFSNNDKTLTLTPFLGGFSTIYTKQ